MDGLGGKEPRLCVVCGVAEGQPHTPGASCAKALASGPTPPAGGALTEITEAVVSKPPLTPPRRRFTLEIHISGDTWPDVLRELALLAPHVSDHGPKCNSVSGGYTTGSFIRISEDPEMTHDRYVAEVEAYLAAKKAAEGGS